MSEHDFLLDVLRGEDGAVEFCELLFAISQTWDDLVDGDRTVTTEQINAAFFKALIRLPASRFYRSYFADLYPVVRGAVYDWLAANALERGNSEDRHLAFVLRDSLTGVVVHCAALVGGHDWAVSRHAEIRRFFHDEPLAQYLAGLEEQTP